MPLKRGTSNKTRESNVREMIESGHPVKQAVAASYREQRSSRAKTSAKRGRK